jgi:hypothetical protein
MLLSLVLSAQIVIMELLIQYQSAKMIVRHEACGIVC